MSVNTPLMGLQKPTIGIDSGLTWEQDVNNNSDKLDAHNHTPGNGAQIPPSGLNINSSLSFNNNQATGLQATTFTEQASLATLNALFVGTDGNLYFNDGVGDPSIKITSGGSVNATTSGISSGSATASFVSSVLVVNAAANTPANIQGGSLLLGNNSAGTKFLTLAPPAAMGANYSLTLPSLPGTSGNFLTIDTSGNIGSNLTVDNSSLQVSSNLLQIKAQGVTQGALALKTTGSSVGLGGIAVSASCGSFTTTSGSFVAVTNLSTTNVTGGRPVWVGLQPDGLGNFIGGFVGHSSGGGLSIEILRGTTVIYNSNLQNGSSLLEVPCGCVWFLDIVAAGTYNYTVKVSASGGINAQVTQCVLISYET